MHPDMTYSIAKLRREELLGARRFPAAAGAGRGRWFSRRRRNTPVAAVVEPAPIVLLLPPRQERDPAGHDQRVA